MVNPKPGKYQAQEFLMIIIIIVNIYMIIFPW